MSAGGYEHPADLRKRQAETLFVMAMTTLEESGPSSFHPMLLPTLAPTLGGSGAESGELMTFAHSPVQVAVSEAIHSIESHAEQWVGYIFVRLAMVHAGGKAHPALLLEAWYYDQWMHVMRGFADDAGTLRWLGPAKMIQSVAPKNHLLRASRVVGTEGFQLVHQLLSELAQGSRDRLSGKSKYDWKARVADLKVPKRQTSVPSYTWADLARNVAWLDRLLSLKAPAVIFDHTMQIACDQFDAMSHL